MLLWLATQVHLKIPLEFIVHFLTQLKVQIILWEMLGSVIQVDTNTTDLLANHLFFFNLYLPPPPSVCCFLKRPEECVLLELERPWATWCGYSQWAACTLDHWAIYHLIIFTENKQDLHGVTRSPTKLLGQEPCLDSLRWATVPGPILSASPSSVCSLRPIRNRLRSEN